jgi:CelD/BcsL family acetyltransferase involved in cellulose biosynthesis
MTATATMPAAPLLPARADRADRKTDRLTVDVRTDMTWSGDDRAALDALIDERPHVGAFLSHAWLSGLFASPPPGFEPLVLMFREGGALRGLVPLATRQTIAGARVTLLGGGHRSDRVDLLAARGFETLLADRLFAWLDDAFGSPGYVLEMRDVPSDSALWAAIRRAIDERGRPFVLMPIEVHAAPYLPLDERDAGSPSERAAKAASEGRHRRLLSRRGQIAVNCVEDEGGVLRAFHSLTGMLHERWGAGRSALDNPETQRFHRHVLPLLLAEDRLRMLQITADGRQVAVVYMLAAGSAAGHAGRWYGYLLAGYDRAWAGRIHLGRLAVQGGIDLSARDGAREFDLLKGSERSKYYWPVRERVTIDANLYSGTSRTQVTRARHEGRDAAVALFKSVRGLFPTQS